MREFLRAELLLAVGLFIANGSGAPGIHLSKTKSPSTLLFREEEVLRGPFSCSATSSTLPPLLCRVQHSE